MKRIIGIILLMLPIIISGQVKLKKKTIENHQTGTVETFGVLKSNKSIRHGGYVRSRRGKIFADGNYNNGQKEIFKYYESDGTVFLEYDYQKCKIISYKEPGNYEHYLDINAKTQADQIPIPLFSPHELILLIAMNVRYPIKAQKNGISGKSKVAIKIDENGSVIDFILFERSHKVLDKESLRVLKNLPKTWAFLPAMENGKAVESYVVIPFNFINE